MSVNVLWVTTNQTWCVGDSNPCPGAFKVDVLPLDYAATQEGGMTLGILLCILYLTYSGKYIPALSVGPEIHE